MRGPKLDPGAKAQVLKYILTPENQENLDRGDLESIYSEAKRSDSDFGKMHLNLGLITAVLKEAGIDILEIGDTIPTEAYFGGAAYGTVKAPSTIKYVKRLAFSTCMDLKRVVLPGVEVVGEFAFFGCPSLTSVEMPNVRIVGSRAFEQCGVRALDMPLIEEIGENAFAGCDLQKIHVGKSLKSVGESAFATWRTALEITYDGTMDEWKRISGTGTLEIGSGGVIICKDGTI